MYKLRLKLKKISHTLILLLLFSSVALSATSGKISGRVIDIKTEEPLSGTNIIVENSSMGAYTDVDGYYVILNVAPGEYDLRAEMMGYAKQKIQDANVRIDLTT
nr:carboxypeptidase-like regulatory domain-containing protein [Candidatus Neomarinimicrobiota bacterium]